MPLFGKSQRWIRPQARTHVALAVTSGGTLRRPCIRLEMAETLYRLFPVVHASKLKRVERFHDRTNGGLRGVDTKDRPYFD